MPFGIDVSDMVLDYVEKNAPVMIKKFRTWLEELKREREESRTIIKKQTETIKELTQRIADLEGEQEALKDEFDTLRNSLRKSGSDSNGQRGS